MKVTYITHACVLLELDNLKILTDPWLVGPCWGGNLWHYPIHKYSPKNLPKPDIIYFSHGHDDHYHVDTIEQFPKSWFKALVVAPRFKKKWWTEPLNSRFENIKYFKHNEIFNVNNYLKLQIFFNDLGHIDSSLKIIHKNKSCFLQTDNLMSIKEAERIGKLGKIDFAFVMPFLTGAYPGFYKMKKKILLEQAKIKNNKSLNLCLNILRKLKPKNVIPYACDTSYLGENFKVNYIHTHDKRLLIQFLKKNKFKSNFLIMNPGDYFKSRNNKLFTKITKYEYNKKSLDKFLHNKKKDFTKYIKNEKKVAGINGKNLISKFKEKIKRELKKIKNFNFKISFIIKETNQKTQNLILDLRTKKIKFDSLGNNSKYDLKISIDSYKIKNLMKKKYPMNFATFSNGGHFCERKKLTLSPNELKFWVWMHDIAF
jgi:hypothetical protein